MFGQIFTSSCVQKEITEDDVNLNVTTFKANDETLTITVDKSEHNTCKHVIHTNYSLLSDKCKQL